MSFFKFFFLELRHCIVLAYNIIFIFVCGSPRRRSGSAGVSRLGEGTSEISHGTIITMKIFEK